MKKAIFIDKDGTLVHNVPYNVNPDYIRFDDGVLEGLRTLRRGGYLLIGVSNQSGIAHGYFSEAALGRVLENIQERLHGSGAALDDFLYCPHHPGGKVPRYTAVCDCRKPKPGMLLRAAGKYDIDLSRSWMIGDILNDVEAGNQAGCRTVLINNGNETEWILADNRKPTVIAGNFKEAADMIMQEI